MSSLLHLVQMRTKLLVLIYLLLEISIYAQGTNWVRHDSLVKAGLNQIYNIRFEQAENTFSFIEKEFPSHPSGTFFKLFIIWWNILLDPGKNSMDEIFSRRVERILELCNNILHKNETNYDALLFKGVTYGLRAEFNIIRKNWVKAIFNGKKALDFAVLCNSIKPNDFDLYFVFGFYHYFTAFVTDHYPVIKPFLYLLPKGDRIRGLKELENAALYGRYSRIEARFFLQVIYYQYEKNFKESIKWGDDLLKEYPNNPRFNHFFRLASSVK